MTQDDVLFGYRLQLFDLAGRTTVTHACRVFGVHRSTYYRWKHEVERQGLEMLRPRERRRPVMPNQLSPITEQRIVAFALGHPGFGPKRIAAQLARPEWGGLVVSPNGVWKALARHGLSTRQKRLSLVAGYRAPYEPPRAPEPEPHVETTRPGELVGIDCFYVGRLHGTKGTVWQLTAIDTYSSYAWAELVVCERGPSQPQVSALARRVAADLQSQGWRLERVLSDNGGEFAATRFTQGLAKLGAGHTRIRSGRPQTNGHVERLHRTILEECWRPAFARFLQVRFMGLRAQLESYVRYYNHERAHTGRITAGRTPAEVVYGARKMEPR
jgi:transposase InsO family protein